MAKKITFRCTGETERFLECMEEQGLTVRDVIARALWLFEKAWTTQHVAIINDEFQIEYIYTSQSSVKPASVVAGEATVSDKGDLGTYRAFFHAEPGLKIFDQGESGGGDAKKLLEEIQDLNRRLVIMEKYLVERERSIQELSKKEKGK